MSLGHGSRVGNDSKIPEMVQRLPKSLHEYICSGPGKSHCEPGRKIQKVTEGLEKPRLSLQRSPWTRKKSLGLRKITVDLEIITEL